MPTTTPEQAFAALRQGGLIPNDPDLVKLFDLSKPDYVAQARAEKPALFHFDARTATPEVAEARLKEIRQGLSRRNFHARCDALLAELREPPAATPSPVERPPPTRPGLFDARAAKSADVDARFKEHEAAVVRGQFAAAGERALDKLQPGRNPASHFDARTAKPEEVEARLSQLIGGY